MLIERLVDAFVAAGDRVFDALQDDRAGFAGAADGLHRVAYLFHARGERRVARIHLVDAAADRRQRLAGPFLQAAETFERGTEANLSRRALRDLIADALQRRRLRRGAFRELFPKR